MPAIDAIRGLFRKRENPFDRAIELVTIQTETINKLTKAVLSRNAFIGQHGLWNEFCKWSGTDDPAS